MYAFGVKHVTKGLGRITEGIMTKGDGSYVEYDDGRRMLDFTCGIGVTSLGKLYFLVGDGLIVPGEREALAVYKKILRLFWTTFCTFDLYADRQFECWERSLFLALPGSPHYSPPHVPGRRQWHHKDIC